MTISPYDAITYVEKHGSIRKAAKAAGIPRTTFQRLLKKAYRTHNALESHRIAQEATESKDDSGVIPPQKSVLEGHAERLGVSAKDHTNSSGRSRVLIIGDTHCPGMRAGYVDFLKRVADSYSVTRVVHIGDLVDWASISYHEKHPVLRDPSSEYRKALEQVAELSQAFPKADWLIGNHDALTERQAVTAGILPELLRSHSDIWQVEWTVHPRFAKLEIDGVIYSHGDSGRGGRDAAHLQSQDNFRSTVIGHFHGQAGVRWFANNDSRIFGLSVGCGIDTDALAFEYGRKFARKPLLGCGVVLNGEQAYFEPWLLKCRK